MSASPSAETLHRTTARVRVQFGQDGAFCPGQANRFVRSQRRALVWKPQAQGCLQVVGLVLVHRPPSATVHQQEAIGPSDFEGQPAAIVQRELVLAGDLHHSGVNAGLLHGRREAKLLVRHSADRYDLFYRGAGPFERQPHRHVANGKGARR